MHVRRLIVLLSIVLLAASPVAGQVEQPPTENGGNGCQECLVSYTFNMVSCQPAANPRFGETYWSGCSGGWTAYCIYVDGNLECERSPNCGERCLWA
jgi:hypothetical protein